MRYCVAAESAAVGVKVTVLKSGENVTVQGITCTVELECRTGIAARAGRCQALIKGQRVHRLVKLDDNGRARWDKSLPLVGVTERLRLRQADTRSGYKRLRGEAGHAVASYVLHAAHRDGVSSDGVEGNIGRQCRNRLMPGARQRCGHGRRPLQQLKACQ